MIELSTLANIAAILTPIVATLAYLSYRIDRFCKDRRLIKYLKSEKDLAKDEGMRSLVHLMAKVGMTGAELLHSSFRNAQISRKLVKDKESGKAIEVLLQWQED